MKENLVRTHLYSVTVYMLLMPAADSILLSFNLWNIVGCTTFGCNIFVGTKVS